MTPIINAGVNNFNNMVSSLTGGAGNYAVAGTQMDSARTTQGQFNVIGGAIGNRIASLGTQLNNTVNNVVSTGEQIWSFYAKKADMELQPNLSSGNYNANNIPSFFPPLVKVAGPLPRYPSRPTVYHKLFPPVSGNPF